MKMSATDAVAFGSSKIAGKPSHLSIEQPEFRPAF